MWVIMPLQCDPVELVGRPVGRSVGRPVGGAVFLQLGKMEQTLARPAVATGHKSRNGRLMHTMPGPEAASQRGTCRGTRYTGATQLPGLAGDSGAVLLEPPGPCRFFRRDSMWLEQYISVAVAGKRRKKASRTGERPFIGVNLVRVASTT